MTAKSLVTYDDSMTIRDAQLSRVRCTTPAASEAAWDHLAR